MHIYVGYPNMSLSLTFDKNVKVEQYIRKKTYNSTVLKSLIEDNVILLYGLTNFSFL